MKQEGSHGLSFYYGDEKFTLQRTHRSKTNKILITVQPDCQITVSAPPQASDRELLEAVRKKSRWIYQQIRTFRKQLENIIPRQYISGESHYYLGKQYMLKVIKTDDEATSAGGVKLFRGKLEVCMHNLDKASTKQLLDRWYKLKAKEVFARRLELLLERTLWVENPPSIRTRSMKKQWGSCSPNQTITLNYHLVKAPVNCIDYVLLHELCHVAEHNHSQKFYRLMTQVMPDWQVVKQRLDAMASRFLSD